MPTYIIYAERKRGLLERILDKILLNALRMRVIREVWVEANSPEEAFEKSKIGASPETHKIRIVNWDTKKGWKVWRIEEGGS